MLDGDASQAQAGGQAPRGIFQLTLKQLLCGIDLPQSGKSQTDGGTEAGMPRCCRCDPLIELDRIFSS